MLSHKPALHRREHWTTRGLVRTARRYKSGHDAKHVLRALMSNPTSCQVPAKSPILGFLSQLFRPTWPIAMKIEQRMQNLLLQMICFTLRCSLLQFMALIPNPFVCLLHFPASLRIVSGRHSPFLTPVVHRHKNCDRSRTSTGDLKHNVRKILSTLCLCRVGMSNWK